jgi:peptidoglycan/xylan/chitin deacetylase (PgdA/CDA1 family)
MNADPRDYAGYGEHPPGDVWPDGARIAVNFVLNFEEGGEASPLAGDPRRDEEGAEVVFPVPFTEREIIHEATFEYGSRVAVWNILRVFDAYERPLTVNAVGQALEANPQVAAGFTARGCDYLGHGYRWIRHHGLTADEIRADVRNCVDAIRRTTGFTIRGWYGRTPISMETRRILAEEGFLFDSTTIDDDLPHYASVSGRPMLIVPYALDTNDSRFGRGNLATAQDYFEYLRDTFDFLYRQGERAPRLMTVPFHSRVLRPGRLIAVERFLDHVAGHSGVWVARRTDIATHFAERFAPSDAWNHPAS